MNDGFVCECGGEMRVKDSRHSGKSVRRRRACVVCRKRVTTYETMTVPPDLSALAAIERTRIEMAALIKRLDDIMAYEDAKARLG